MLSCFSRVQLFATLWTIARQAPLSTGFSRHEYWSGLPCPPPGDLPNPGTEPTSYISFIGRQVLVTSAIWEAPMMVSVSTKNKQTNKKKRTTNQLISSGVELQHHFPNFELGILPIIQYCLSVSTPKTLEIRRQWSTDNQEGPTVQHMELYSITCNN